MTATLHVTLWCDTPDCMMWTDHGPSTINETRRLARSEGWSWAGGADLCPYCTRGVPAPPAMPR